MLRLWLECESNPPIRLIYYSLVLIRGINSSILLCVWYTSALTDIFLTNLINLYFEKYDRILYVYTVSLKSSFASYSFIFWLLSKGYSKTRTSWSRRKWVVLTKTDTSFHRQSRDFPCSILSATRCPQSGGWHHSTYFLWIQEVLGQRWTYPLTFCYSLFPSDWFLALLLPHTTALLYKNCKSEVNSDSNNLHCLHLKTYILCF